MNDLKTPPVILIHGLHMHKWAMRPLANRLANHGFDTHCFGYFSMSQTLESHSRRLNQFLLSRFSPNDPIYLVGHSLGGLVIRDFLYRYTDWQIPRVVTLGSPHSGSISANRMMNVMPSMIGRSYAGGLDGKVAMLRKGVALGSIAGNVSAGLGRVILPKNISANDGTVLIEETMLQGQADHIILPVSHTGMILDKNVVLQVASFLRDGQFNHN